MWFAYVANQNCACPVKDEAAWHSSDTIITAMQRGCVLQGLVRSDKVGEAGSTAADQHTNATNASRLCGNLAV